MFNIRFLLQIVFSVTLRLITTQNLVLLMGNPLGNRKIFLFIILCLLKNHCYSFCWFLNLVLKVNLIKVWSLLFCKVFWDSVTVLGFMLLVLCLKRLECILFCVLNLTSLKILFFRRFFQSLFSFKSLNVIDFSR